MDTVWLTSGGTVRGAVEGGVRTFLGVPYGASTAGAARFLAPRPVVPWEGVRDALAFGPSSWQRSQAGMEDMLSMWGGCPERSMSEDCLVLNAWAPAEPPAPLPVLVYLHGGGHGIGSGSWPAYDGSRLASRGDAVVVTINHRLGVLGYLYLADLVGSEYATSGINGILDIVEALRWLQENVGAIGGDPDRVLVYGQSGGGAKTATLLAMPSSHGLYRAAGIMSCPMAPLQSPEAATETADRLLRQLGIKPSAIDELLSVSAERLVEATQALGNPLSSFQPVRDGIVAVDDPLLMAADGRMPDVPLLIGTTRDEFATLSPGALVPQDADDAWVRDQVRSFVGDRTADVVAAYRERRPTATPRELQVAISTDALFRVGSVRLAEAKAAASGSVWMYRFDWETPAEGFAGTAPHGVDTTFFFDNTGAAGVSREGPGRHRLATRASGALVALAATGSPQHDGLPDWPSFGIPRRSTMLFDVESRVTDDPMQDVRDIWEGVPAGDLSRMRLAAPPERDAAGTSPDGGRGAS